MSVHTIEEILWGLGEDQDRRKTFLKDPDKYVQRFPLTEDERQMVTSFDLKALEAHGVSNMLLMNSWNAVNGGSPLLIFEFLKKLNDGKLTNQMKIKGWQFAAVKTALAIRNIWISILCFFGLKRRFS